MRRPTAVPAADSLPAVGAVRASGRSLWVRLVVGTICQGLLAMLVFFALWAALPAVLGWQPTTVSSGSMMPRLRVGDVAVAKPVTQPPALNQVLLFRDPDHPDKLRLHRFVRVDDQGRMVTRGDANAGEDSSPITMDALHGVAVLRVPFVALPIVWLREGRWFALGLSAAGLVLLLTGSRLHRGQETDDDPPPSRRDRRSAAPGGPVRPRWSRSRRPVAAFVAVVTVLGTAGLVVAGPAWARYTAMTANTDNSLASASYYRCDNAVLPQNPYLYYELDETSGTTAADSSGNGRAGTFTGGTSVGTSSVCTARAQRARTLNGSTGYIATPTQLSAPNTFTVQAWFKTTSTTGGRIIGFGNLRTGASASVDRHVYMSNAGRLLFGVQTAANSRITITSTAAYNDGGWHLVTASLSPAGMRLYVDNTLVASRAATTAGMAYTGYWRVGYDNLANWTNVPTSSYFGGTVEQVAVYQAALSSQAITDIYTVGRP